MTMAMTEPITLSLAHVHEVIIIVIKLWLRSNLWLCIIMAYKSWTTEHKQIHNTEEQILLGIHTSVGNSSLSLQ